MSVSSPPVIFLLREATPSDPYEQVFREAGFEPHSFPVLQFRFINQERLREALARPGAYSGLILTSPRAVEALSEAMVWLPHQQSAWHAKPVFAVGPRTAQALAEVGFVPEGEEERGSGDLLADYITARAEARPFEEPLLFLCGARRRETLPMRLQAASILFEELFVYETMPRTDLTFPATPRPRWAAFFSPSGVEVALQAAGVDWAGVRKAAIGPTTAAALEEAGWTPEAVAAEPAPEALLAAVREAEGAGRMP